MYICSTVSYENPLPIVMKCMASHHSNTTVTVSLPHCMLLWAELDSGTCNLNISLASWMEWHHKAFFLSILGALSHWAALSPVKKPTNIMLSIFSVFFLYMATATISFFCSYLILSETEGGFWFFSSDTKLVYLPICILKILPIPCVRV